MAHLLLLTRSKQSSVEVLPALALLAGEPAPPAKTQKGRSLAMASGMAE